MQKVVDFLKMFWYDLTKNMRTWTKYVIGIPLYIVCIVFMPVCLVIILCGGAIGVSAIWVGNKIKPMVFKDDSTT